jgi:hypothetical protein
LAFDAVERCGEAILRSLAATTFVSIERGKKAKKH